MKDHRFIKLCEVVMPCIAAAAFFAGMVTIIGTVTFHAVPAAFHPAMVPQAFPPIPWLTGALLLAIALACGIGMLLTLGAVEHGTDKRAVSDKLFTRYLIGIGYFLFVDAVVNMVAIAGFARAGQLERIFPLGDGALKVAGPSGTSWLDPLVAVITAFHRTDDPLVLTIILILSLGMALLGALFYFANALWDLFKGKEVYFDRNVFWGGLWFRLAEAIVLTIAVFLFLQFQGYAKAIRYMPMISLLIGMTVKSSETLIFGVAERLLASITAFVEPAKDSSAAATTASAASLPAQPPTVIATPPPHVAVPPNGAGTATTLAFTAATNPPTG